MGESETLLALVGLRGTGKSTLGRLLAERLGWPFDDLDERLVDLAPPEAAGTAEAGEILERLGEPAFRELEGRALAEALAAPRPRVLATGGGVVEREANRRLLASCRCLWLRAAPEVLARRVAADRASRPSLLGLEPLEELRELERRRAPHYRALAELEVETGTKDAAALADEIFRRLTRRSP